MSFYYILLGHLIGDFVLQTSRIAVNKPRHRRWNMLHAVIVTLCMLVFAVPFGLTAALFAVFAGILHLLIDKAKPAAVEKFKLPELAAFMADQALHITVIAFAPLFSSSTPAIEFLNKFQVLLLIVFITVTFFAAILNQYHMLIIFPREDNTFFRRGEKLAGIIIRFLITLGIFLAVRYTPLYLLLLPAAPAVLFLHARICKIERKSLLELPIRLLLDTLFSAAGACVLLNIG